MVQVYAITMKIHAATVHQVIPENIVKGILLDEIMT
jgi:hypothetical protein